jgi:hypothetical protein
MCCDQLTRDEWRCRFRVTLIGESGVPEAGIDGGGSYPCLCFYFSHFPFRFIQGFFFFFDQKQVVKLDLNHYVVFSFAGVFIVDCTKSIWK